VTPYVNDAGKIAEAPVRMLSEAGERGCFNDWECSAFARVSALKPFGALMNKSTIPGSQGFMRQRCARTRACVATALESGLRSYTGFLSGMGLIRLNSTIFRRRRSEFRKTA
jgi:hypothetical protein